MNKSKLCVVALKSCLQHLHPVVEKGVEGNLWRCFWVHLWPTDVQDEGLAVVQVSHLSVGEGGSVSSSTRFKTQLHARVLLWFWKIKASGGRCDTRPKLEGHRADFFETIIALVYGAQSLQFHLWRYRNTKAVKRDTLVDARKQPDTISKGFSPSLWDTGDETARLTTVQRHR